VSDILKFSGGLALFLYGMWAVSDGLAALLGERGKEVIEKCCRRPWQGVLLGTLLTALLQSSSATTVMVVGFVNAGAMNLYQAVGVIMGANLGTTATAWLLSLVGLRVGGALSLFKPDALGHLLTAVGVVLLLFFKKRKRGREWGSVLCAFGILFTGLVSMSGVASSLATSPAAGETLALLESPVAGLLAGALLTAVIQSSSASVGILQALAASGRITLGMAVPIVMGQNIGTCATALLSAVGTSPNAHRAARLHLYFNLFGAAALLPCFELLCGLGILPRGVAVTSPDVASIHTAFNLTATLLLLPFTRQLVKMVTAREKKKVSLRAQR